MTAREDEVNVTDADIERIIRENQPGVASLWEAYERAQAAYFGAVAATSREAVVVTTTTTAPLPQPEL